VKYRLASSGRALSEPCRIVAERPKALKLLLKVPFSRLLSLCSDSGNDWSQWPGLNRRPTVYETVALPLSYIGFQARGDSMGDASGVSDGKQPLAPLRTPASSKASFLGSVKCNPSFLGFRHSDFLSPRFAPVAVGGSDFELRVSDFLRHSTFEIRPSSSGVTGSIKSQQSAPKK
jgi:hypothetical protein